MADFKRQMTERLGLCMRMAEPDKRLASDWLSFSLCQHMEDLLL